MHKNFACRALLAVLVGLPVAAAPAHAAKDIGEAASIITGVEGRLAGDSASIGEGDRVFQDQVIVSDATGVAQIAFRDGTRLAVGPSSTVTLDTFVYSDDASAAKVAISLAKGSFRFLSGSSGNDAYEITTPSATIGVRGTAFDIYADGSGDLAIAMIEGEVIVCPSRGTCRDHGITGRFLHLTGDGVFALHDAWDGTFLADVAFVRAFPFIADQSPLLDPLRGSVAVIGSYAVTTAETVTDVGKATGEAVGGVIEKIVKPAAPKIRAPKIRVPKLFK